MSLLARLMPWKTKTLPADAGYYYFPITGGFLPADIGANWNFWQLGYNVGAPNMCSAMVEACLGAYSQTIAMCPGSHWRQTSEAEGRMRVTNSALARILYKPNAYQTISDFLLNATRSLYVDGNAYALALRNNRFEVSELHLMRPTSSAALVAETGEVFYSLGGNEIMDRLVPPPVMVPARDVLHMRLHTPRSILRGESPMMAAALDIAAGGAISQQQLAFYLNQGRPSNILSTDQQLTPKQADDIRARWNEQSKGLAVGGTPILGWGIKPMPLASSARESQLAEYLNLTKENIALAYRIPLQVFGIGPTPFASTEALMQFWLASGLGFALNHIEEAFGTLFGLDGYPDDYLEFDTTALLRSQTKDEIDALARGVSGGIFAPNEARARLQLPRAKAGDEPRLQAQVVPLSAAGMIPAAPSAPAAPVGQPRGRSNEQQRDVEHTRRCYRSARNAAAG